VNSQKQFVVVCVFLGGLTYGGAALAYLDPGTGSMIIQGIVGAIAGAFVVIKLYWYQVKRWFSRISGRDDRTQKNTSKTDALESPTSDQN
jgi:outer membrane lipoprotein SlyB